MIIKVKAKVTPTDVLFCEGIGKSLRESGQRFNPGDCCFVSRVKEKKADTIETR